MRISRQAMCATCAAHRPSLSPNKARCSATSSSAFRGATMCSTRLQQSHWPMPAARNSRWSPVRSRPLPVRRGASKHATCRQISASSMITGIILRSLPRRCKPRVRSTRNGSSCFSNRTDTRARKRLPMISEKSCKRPTWFSSVMFMPLPKHRSRACRVRRLSMRWRVMAKCLQNFCRAWTRRIMSSATRCSRVICSSRSARAMCTRRVRASRVTSRRWRKSRRSRRVVASMENFTNRWDVTRPCSLEDPRSFGSSRMISKAWLRRWLTAASVAFRCVSSVAVPICWCAMAAFAAR